MQVTVFCAAGGTGRHVVEEALAVGHDVTVLVRDPLEVGDARDPDVARWGREPGGRHVLPTRSLPLVSEGMPLGSWSRRRRA